MLLQETHSKPNIKRWEKEWKSKSFQNSCNQEISSGIAILIKENTELAPTMYEQDQKGKMLQLAYLF